MNIENLDIADIFSKSHKFVSTGRFLDSDYQSQIYLFAQKNFYPLNYSK